MITSYTLALSPESGLNMQSDCAYRLYSWLLSKIPTDYAEILHIQENHPVSHYIYRKKDDAMAYWRINLLIDEAISLFANILEEIEHIDLNAGSFYVSDRSCSGIVSTRDLILNASELAVKRATLHFHSATSFKQNGNYVIFPQERLIVRSLVNRWNSFCRDYPLDDEDALKMLEQRISIADYNLHSQRYLLKANYISGFVGKITLRSNLPAPLEQLWSTLLYWAPYSGLGIKTTLGMGGVSVSPSVFHHT